MGSTRQPDQTIAAGIPIPQWMKTKMNDRFDLEDTAFSPPNQDDSFFYMRYPRHNVATEKLSTPTETIVSTDKVKIINCNTDHQQTANMTDVVINKENTHLSKTAKSFGGDDMFRGDHTGYGNSIVQVAHQMISGGLVGRPAHFGHKHSEEERDSPPPPQQRMRRSSKSLPASPLSTPDSTPQIHRKNRYFTNPFVETDSDRYSKYPGSWLLAGVLGTQREAAGSRDTLDGSQLDLADPDPHHDKLDNSTPRTESLRRNKSSVSMFSEQQENTLVGVAPSASAIASASANVKDRPKKSLPPNGTAASHRPKPSELRELNFWSPTSM